MNLTYKLICLAIVFQQVQGYSQDGQNRIPLNNVFLEKAIEYKVKKRPSSCNIDRKNWKKSWNCFGPYVISNWKKEPTDGETRRNFWGSRFEQMEFNEWFYDLGAPNSDTLEVYVAYRFSSEEAYSIQPLDNVPISFGEDELLSNRLNIAVTVGTGEPEDVPWTLLLSFVEGSKENPDFKGMFFRENLAIEVLPLRSETELHMGLVPMSSRGFVFSLDGRQIAAVQNFTSNPWKWQDQFVWMDSELDPELQMNISAAVTALILMRDDQNFIEASGISVYSED